MQTKPPVLLRIFQIPTFAVFAAAICTARPSEAAEFKVSYNSDWPPYSAGVGSDVQGILPKLMEEIVGSRMGIKVSHHGYPWKRAQKVVEMGRLDAIVTVPTESRLKFSNRSENIVYTIEMRPAVARGSVAESRISAAPKPNTLKRLKQCDIVGNGWGKRFADKHGLSPHLASKVSGCLRMIANGRFDVTVQSLAVLNRSIAEDKLGGKVAVLSTPYGNMRFTLLVSKKSRFGADFMRKFDKTMADMNADGSYAKLIRRLVSADN